MHSRDSQDLGVHQWLVDAHCAYGSFHILIYSVMVCYKLIDCYICWVMRRIGWLITLESMGPPFLWACDGDDIISVLISWFHGKYFNSHKPPLSSKLMCTC